ncbi:hypothetical protein ATANTOWER_002356, partial [Ataeniobius toweri]|nr:hypothetical protein [Ataeniobius toweri]
MNRGKTKGSEILNQEQFLEHAVGECREVTIQHRSFHYINGQLVLPVISELTEAI